MLCNLDVKTACSSPNRAGNTRNWHVKGISKAVQTALTSLIVRLWGIGSTAQCCTPPC